MVFYPTDPEKARDDVVLNLHNIVLQLPPENPRPQRRPGTIVFSTGAEAPNCFPRGEAGTQIGSSEPIWVTDEERRDLESFDTVGRKVSCLDSARIY